MLACGGRAWFLRPSFFPAFSAARAKVLVHYYCTVLAKTRCTACGGEAALGSVLIFVVLCAQTGARRRWSAELERRSSPLPPSPHSCFVSLRRNALPCAQRASKKSGRNPSKVQGVRPGLCCFGLHRWCGLSESVWSCMHHSA